MWILNLTVILIGALITMIATASVEGISGSMVVIAFLPYLALGALGLVVQARRSSMDARRASLADSIIVVAVSAWFYIPIILDRGAGCMTGMVFLLAIRFLISVPFLFCFVWG